MNDLLLNQKIKSIKEDKDKYNELKSKEDNDSDKEIDSNNKYNENKDDEYDSSFDEEPPEIHFESKPKKVNPGLCTFINDYLTRNVKEIQRYDQTKRTVLIISLFIIALNLLIKMIISIYIWIWFFKDKNDFKEKITNEMFDELSNFKEKLIIIIIFINRFSLLFGVLFFTICCFVECLNRIYFVLFSPDKSISLLVFNKIIFILSLGCFPELVIEMFNFKNQNNFIIKAFIAKLFFQPFLILFLVIYSIILIKMFYPIETREENIKNHIGIYITLFHSISNSELFKWNTLDNYYEDSINHKEDRQSNSSISDSQKYSDLNDNKDNHEYIDNFYSFFFVKIKIKHIILFIMFFILILPFFNGIFGYGYLVFYQNNNYIRNIFFKLDILLSIIFGFSIIRLNK